MAKPSILIGGTILCVVAVFSVFLMLGNDGGRDATRMPSKTEATMGKEGATRLPARLRSVLSDQVSLDAAEYTRVGDTWRLEDRSMTAYASVVQDIQIDDDMAWHQFNIEVKTIDSPLAQVVMHMMGGKTVSYFAYIDLKAHTVISTEGKVEYSVLGDGWLQVSIQGRNNQSGNRVARLQVYPRHGKPEDQGAILVRNAMFR